MVLPILMLGFFQKTSYSLSFSLRYKMTFLKANKIEVFFSCKKIRSVLFAGYFLFLSKKIV